MSLEKSRADAAEMQINQMCAFIKQEATEKAEEIRVKTDKEFMAEKLQLETQASLAVRAEHERNVKNYYISKKIEKSKKMTEARFETMRKRDDKMQELRARVLSKLSSVSKNNSYPQLIRYLIAQGLMTLMESKVKIQCRREDLKIVESELQAGITLFKTTASKASGVTPVVEVTIDTEYLPPAPTGAPGPSCTGGLLLSAREGQLLCRNTLDHRLDIVFDRLKPTLRGLLWGVRDSVKKDAASSSSSHHH